jgi:flagellar hook protein FlgE
MSRVADQRLQNAGGLEAVGNGYFLPSATRRPIGTTAATGGAGVIKGQSLEKSNVDIATEFVNMMQAQNGYQANARTIRVANAILSELTSLIR